MRKLKMNFRKNLLLDQVKIFLEVVLVLLVKINQNQNRSRNLNQNQNLLINKKELFFLKHLKPLKKHLFRKRRKKLVLKQEFLLIKKNRLKEKHQILKNLQVKNQNNMILPKTLHN